MLRKCHPTSSLHWSSPLVRRRRFWDKSCWLQMLFIIAHGMAQVEFVNDAYYVAPSLLNMYFYVIFAVFVHPVGSSLDYRRRYLAKSWWSSVLFKVYCWLLILLWPQFYADIEFCLLTHICFYTDLYSVYANVVLLCRTLADAALFRWSIASDVDSGGCVSVMVW